MSQIDIDATFPATIWEIYLCALLCDLIKFEPNLSEIEYIDCLVIAVKYESSSRLLIGDERREFVSLCEKSPLITGASRKIPWRNLKQLLSLRKAIRVEDESIRLGSNWNEVRHSYPPVSIELMTLLRKAATRLRELQESVK